MINFMKMTKKRRTTNKTLEIISDSGRRYNSFEIVIYSEKSLTNNGEENRYI